MSQSFMGMLQPSSTRLHHGLALCRCPARPFRVQAELEPAGWAFKKCEKDGKTLLELQIKGAADIEMVIAGSLLCHESQAKPACVIEGRKNGSNASMSQNFR